MLKKFLDGIAFGTGLGLAMSAVFVLVAHFLVNVSWLDGTMPGPAGDGGSSANTVASVALPGRYLGSTGIYARNFPSGESKDLAEGPGLIVGSAQVDGKPLEGLRLRLALNGSVMSHWTSTGPDGVYVVHVPYGEYIIDGYELDAGVANRVLPGKIEHPANMHWNEAFQVAADSDGTGLLFRFVDPVVRKFNRKKFSATDDVVLEWEPYAGAVGYSVQLFRKTDPQTWKSEHVFSWSELPVVTEPRFSFREHGVKPEPGSYYDVQIVAIDSNDARISSTLDSRNSYDLMIAD